MWPSMNYEVGYICFDKHLIGIHYLFFQHVFEYFKDRTPRSINERRDISLVWNYKYAGNFFYT